MGSGGGLVRGNGGMTTTTITVWEMGKMWTMANRRRERRKYEAGYHCLTSSGMMDNVNRGTSK